MPTAASPVRRSVSRHASAAMPNFLITEYFVNFEPIGAKIACEPFQVENGYIPLPTHPGLGIDLDEDTLAEHPYRDFPDRNLRHPLDEGP